MGCWKTCTCLVCLLGLASAQTAPQAAVGPTLPAWTSPASNLTKLEPIVLSAAGLDEKVITLHLAPRIATSIRLPESVNSVVLGDPEAFQAEHSEHEPELVTVRRPSLGFRATATAGARLPAADLGHLSETWYPREGRRHSRGD